MRQKIKSRAGLARAIKKVANLRTMPIQYVTRSIYLEFARENNLKVVRSKGTIQDLGGFSAARKLASKL